MEDKLKKRKKVLVDKLEMPKEIVLDVPRITVIGRNEITIENHKGILIFEKNEIKIKKFGLKIFSQSEFFYICNLEIHNPITNSPKITLYTANTLKLPFCK